MILRTDAERNLSRFNWFFIIIDENRLLYTKTLQNFNNLDRKR